MFAKHSCLDSRLACVQCSIQICPKCMVVCPVGNRCQSCATKTESHAVKVTPVVLVKVGLGSLAAGYLFGWICGHMPTYGFYGWIGVYLGGLLVGNILHKLSGFKLGNRICSVVAAALIAGGVAGTLIHQQQPLELLAARYAASQEMSAQTAAKQAKDMPAGATDEAPARSGPTAQQVQEATAKIQQAALIGRFISLAIYCFGAVSPFAGLAPINFLRRRI